MAKITVHGGPSIAEETPLVTGPAEAPAEQAGPVSEETEDADPAPVARRRRRRV